MRSLAWLIGAAALAVAPSGKAAPMSASAAANASATVASPITVVKTTDLAFGALVRPSLGVNTVTLDPSSGVRTLSGAGDAALVGSAASLASYAVGGEGGAAFSVSLPSNVVITRLGGADTLPVSLAANARSGALSGTAGETGAFTLTVGGSLALSSSTTPGTYTGAFSVTVGYN